MVKCCESCSPCCEFCVYAKRFYWFVNGQTIKSGVEGCNKHSDEHHQSMAQNLGYCKQFCCINSKETQNGT